MFGTARYASPEQARGSQLDARSDLYSLALVLVESVTGRLPFAADTTLGMLTARTLQPIVASEALGPLEPVIDRVGAIDPNDRYPDAATMRQAIADAADTLPPPGPLLLAGMVDRADPHPTRAAPERTAPLFDQDATEVVRSRELTIAAEPIRNRRDTGERRLVPWIVAIVLIVTVGLAAAALAQVSSAKPVSIPGLRGLSIAQATKIARTAGLDVTVGAPKPHPIRRARSSRRARPPASSPGVVTSPSSCRPGPPTSRCPASRTCRGRRRSRRSTPRA